MKTRLLIVAASVLCFVAACSTPALAFIGREDMFGAEALLIGPLAVLIGQFSWLANLLGFVALILVLCARFRGAAIFSILGLIAANHAWALFGREIPGDEGGVTKYYLKSLQIGFYLWLLSFLVLALGAIAAKRWTDARTSSARNPAISGSLQTSTERQELQRAVNEAERDMANGRWVEHSEIKAKMKR